MTTHTTNLINFGFESEIEKLDKANRLYPVVMEFADPRINLHPDQVSNHDMGYVFEELVHKFHEQANEEPWAICRSDMLIKEEPVDNIAFGDDAWNDHVKTKVGYEIPINRHFYVYELPRPLEEIEWDIKGLEKAILEMLKKVTA